MNTILALAAAVTVAGAAERQLLDRLPGIFARSAEHYKALDAAATPLMRNAKGEAFTPHGYLRDARKLDMRSIFWWTAGHFPGSLWYLYEATGDEALKARATAWTELLAPASKMTHNHDIGFIMNCSFGNARRLLGVSRYDDLLVEAADTLTKRYNPKLGLIRSWGKVDDEKDFLVIPDNMMNLELLELGTKLTKDRRFAAIARSHASVTMKHHFRADGGTYHVLNYCPKDGRVQEIRRGQGAQVGTAWSRGQSWAIYGYTMMFRESGKREYLDFAQKVADFAIDHPNMPADGIPYWDYGVKGEERDSSAGSIMASGLLELCRYVEGGKGAKYRAFAVKQLLSLASDAYFSKGDEIGHFLLKHGVGSKPRFIQTGTGGEVDAPLDYGDYYFLEALLRFRALQTDRAAEIAALLPEKPAPVSPDYRPSGDAAAVKRAEQLLKEPVPAFAKDLYLEFMTTGNRSHFDSWRAHFVKRLQTLVDAEAHERKGRFLPAVAERLEAICGWPSWVLAAHDRDKDVLEGRRTCIELVSSALACQLAETLCTLGDALPPETVARVRKELDARIFRPYLAYASFVKNGQGETPPWWFLGRSNWTAVCHSGCVRAALAAIPDRATRAVFVEMAERATPTYLSGFTDDGYCSEGMAYWNYGYGNFLTLGLAVRAATDGKVDLFKSPRALAAMKYPFLFQLQAGRSPRFADGGGDPVGTFLGWGCGIWPELKPLLGGALPLRGAFPDGQVWIMRTAAGSGKPLALAFKGGHNGELHNHNDVGSYTIMLDGTFLTGDPGEENYTARTFSSRRYESGVLNSFGHPVPRLGGKLQHQGRSFGAKIVSTAFADDLDTVTLDLSGAYDCPTLKSLTRTFAFDRTARRITVRDAVKFSAPTAFDVPLVFDGHGDALRIGTKALGGDWEWKEDRIPNPGRAEVLRRAVTFKSPVTEAEVEFEFMEK